MNRRIGRGDLATLGRKLEPEPSAAELRELPRGALFAAVFAGPIARNATRRRLLAERAAADPARGPSEADS